MDYKQTAKKLASKGRYGDSMLVHMNPKEVAGIQYLGNKYGAKMTINPHTGLPEAFNFMRFLPMIAGAALAPYTGGASAALIVGGAEAARTGNIMKGFQAGLGAFGGANIASGIGTMGAEQGVAEATASNLNAVNAGPALPGAAAAGADVTGSQVLAAQQPGQLTDFISKQAGGAAPGTEAYRLAGEKYATAATNAQQAAPAGLGTADFRPTYSQMGSGVERLGTTEGLGRATAGIMNNPMTAIKTAGSTLLALNEEPEPYKKPEIDYSKYPKAEPYKRNYVANPNPREDREWMYYQPNALYVRNGGQTKFNIGGLAGNYTDYLQQIQQMINMQGKGYGVNPALPGSAGANMGAMTPGSAPTKMDKMRAYKSGGSAPELEDGGFVLRASTVNGVGNGSSEAGLKYLQQKLGAVPIKGQGDGTSDDIPTTIAGKRKALVSNEEAYVPRNIVERIGDGDVNRGAKELDQFMKRVDKAKTGKPKPPKQINPDKYLPKGKSNAQNNSRL